MPFRPDASPTGTALLRVDASRHAPDDALIAAALTAEDRARAAAMLRPSDRRRRLIFRAALRIALAERIGAAPRRLRFALGPHGKPRLDPPRADLSFNLSHAEDLCLIAIGDGAPLGVDLERRDRPIDPARFMARWLGPEERAALAALPEAARAEACLRAWTAKEAYLKATGEGLAALPPEAVQIACPPGGPLRLLSVRGRPEAPARWRLTDLSDAQGVATLAVGPLDAAERATP